jgi:hypothetical protein
VLIVGGGMVPGWGSSAETTTGLVLVTSDSPSVGYDRSPDGDRPCFCAAQRNPGKG